MFCTLFSIGQDRESIVEGNGAVDTQQEQQIRSLTKPIRRVRFRVKEPSTQCDANDKNKWENILTERYYRIY